jgi:hypothetical protein
VIITMRDMAKKDIALLHGWRSQNSITTPVKKAMKYVLIDDTG